MCASEALTVCFKQCGETEAVHEGIESECRRPHGSAEDGDCSVKSRCFRRHTNLFTSSALS